ncbi:hypothetical protein [Mesorhizobium sp. M2A.F.Ca.ET.067.02.1.1]|uniref:hypothetical protein n=1 Tax=Mesorhizobium sp. M2A.F.Ca.ET.067.02.1.1 TaxID=2496749 RepID=UPI000FD4FD90|nr:hypothetical protein [Mesorhizobium sp. M2A.F.Ca.ET.067.02.1.1]RUW81553.1 hypothetical protein EOA28_01100 [Mesorhizobium sp. M2A.F.Ca.ET.067.02.1.1]TIU58118.1 MAG: hypothetical protein E5W35_05855 [Mesorhizobium sp.]
MTLNDLAASLHQKSGFGGARLEAITFAAAIGMSRYAGAEHQTYFKQRFAETIEKLSSSDALDVVGFVAKEAGIQPSPSGFDTI